MLRYALSIYNTNVYKDTRIAALSKSVPKTDECVKNQLV